MYQANTNNSRSHNSSSKSSATKTNLDNMINVNSTGSVDNKDISKGAAIAALLDHNDKTSGPVSSSINLLKSIIGAGMLSLPFAVSLVGIIPAGILLILSLVMAILGLFFLVMCASRLCHRDATFANISKHTFPTLAPLFDLAIAIKCIGVALSYLSIASDLLPIVIQAIFLGNTPVAANTPKAIKFFTSRLFWTSAIVGGIAPVTFMRKIDSLKYTSFLGMASVAYLLVLSCTLFIQHWSNVSSPWKSIQWFAPLKWTSLKSFSIFVFAFTCHQNILPIQNEARDNTPRSMMRIIISCTITSFLVYLTLAYTSYATFAGTAKGPAPNIIQSYPVTGAPFIIARLLYALLVIFSYPLQTFPFRMSTLKFVSYFWPAFAIKQERLLYISATLAILTATWALTVLHPPLDSILAIVGSTAGPTICYILPSLFWLKLEKNCPWNRTSIIALCLLLFGILAIIIPLTSIIISSIVK